MHHFAYSILILYYGLRWRLFGPFHLFLLGPFLRNIIQIFEVFHMHSIQKAGAATSTGAIHFE